MKKIVLFVAFLLLLPAVFFAQQITKFGVVDTSRVYTTYFRDSAPVRNYEAKKAEFQNEVTRLTDELTDLQQKKIDYQKAKNNTALLRVTGQIAEKSEFLTEYTTAKNAELSALKKSLETSDEFYSKLYSTLEKIAESEGYSLILSLQQANAILWYSSGVDITDKVISALGN